MNPDLIEKIKYSSAKHIETHQLPLPLVDSLQLISDFYASNKNNKLCLVFPTKEFAAQWLSIPTVLFLIKSDFDQFKNEIVESLKKYEKGNRIILNNEAVVEWVGRSADGFVFKHKEFNGVAEITINVKKITKIQPAPISRNALSAYKRVIESLNRKNDNPTDRILGITTDGNKLFQKNSICLISKHISLENSISEISINNFLITEYFKHGKIDDTGESDISSPFLISNNLTNLALYVTMSESVAKIIIDGYSAIHEKIGDFNDIDAKNIPTILITDLSEIGSFEKIGDFGFDFFNFTKETLQFDDIKPFSPFNSFDEKLKKYVSFKLQKEICINSELENTTQLIHSIEKDDSVKELVNIKIALIQLTNLISRIVHPINENEVTRYMGMLSKIQSLFLENRFYLGGSVKAIEECISLLDSVIVKFAVEPSEKYTRLFALLNANHYDYIICTTEDEAGSLNFYLKSLTLHHKPKVIAVSELNNNLLENKPMTAILTGWAKTNNVNRLLSSFLFSELTVLFYQFESHYFNSLQNRNNKYSGNVKSTIDKNGVQTETRPGNNDFSDLYKLDQTITLENSFDIAEFELRLENAQFSKYIVKGNLNDSVKAKKIEFKNDKFIYLTDTHGLVVLDNFQKSSTKPLYIHKSRIENLHHGDVIAFLKTERELLNKIVAKQTTSADLAETNRWIELWKHLLRNHFKLINNDFNRLIRDLEKHGCKRDPVTIRSWLHDELKIGPRKDDDLISIAIMTNGTELYNNIKQVRNAIRQMTGWRMKASDFVIEQLKSKIKATHPTIQVNTIIDVEDLGEIEILEITEISSTHNNVDVKNVNRLLEKAKL